MPQVFAKSSNYLAKATVGLAGLLLVTIVLVGSNITPYTHRVGVALEQPAPFSHKHHFTELGIDCRYCHTTVETGKFAGIPPTETCMTCHSQIWTNSPLLEVVRKSYDTGEPVRWNRVNRVPGFVYFDHSIHVTKGISCFTCHGDVDQMNLTYKGYAMQMDWCLDCHRNPEMFIRPPNEVFNPKYEVKNQKTIGQELVEKANIRHDQITDCVVCHR